MNSPEDNISQNPQSIIPPKTIVIPSFNSLHDPLLVFCHTAPDRDEDEISIAGERSNCCNNCSIL